MLCYRLVVERGTIIGYRLPFNDILVDISYDFLDRSKAGKELIHYLNSISTVKLVYNEGGVFGTSEEHKLNQYYKCIDEDIEVLSSLLLALSVDIKNSELNKVTRGKFVDTIYSYEFLVDKVVRAEIKVRVDKVEPIRGVGWDLVLRLDVLASNYIIYSVVEEDRECSFSDECEEVRYKMIVRLDRRNYIRRFNLLECSEDLALVTKDGVIGVIENLSLESFKGYCEVQDLSEKLECLLDTGSELLFVTSRKFYFNDTKPEYYSVSVYSSMGDRSCPLVRNKRLGSLDGLRCIESGGILSVFSHVLSNVKDVYHGGDMLSRLA